MANETTIDAETARRLLLIFSLEGDVEKEEKEWALGIIHQIPGYAGITMEKAVRDDFLRKVLVAIAAEQLSSTTPKELETLIEDAQKREAALKSAKETGEKRAEEFIEAAEKAAKTKAQIEVSPVTPEAPSKEEALPKEGFSIKVSQSFVKEFSSVGKAAAYAPLKVVSFFSPPPSLRGAVQDATATSLALTDLAAKARAARNIEEKRVFQALHDALEEAQYSAVARLNLPMRLASITGVRVTLLSGQELGLPQGQAAALLQTSAGKPSLLGTIGKGLGQRLLGQASGKLVKGFLGKAAAKLGAAAAGAPAGPPGIIAGAFASFAPDLLSWITRNAPKVAIGIGAFLFGTGFILQSNILMVGGVGVGFGGFIGQSGGFGPALSKAGGLASSVISGITSLTVASIATPLIVALISIPVLVAVILFIINSGAYLVPPSALSLSENPYIKVEKVASPEGPFQNSQIPVTVQYTITIRALKGTLTNIFFDYECEVIRKGSAPDCPPAELFGPDNNRVSRGKQEGLTISPVNPYVITYTATYSSSSFSDSAIIDTFSITADTPEEAGTSTSGSAAIIIGNPPTGCFEFTDDWPADAKAREMAAIAEMSRAEIFMTKLCRKGTILLDHEPQVARWGGWAKGYKHIVIYPLGVANRSSALYTLSHESGHILAQVTDLYQRYLDTQGLGGERPICTYPEDNHAVSEDFAEMVALYYSNQYGRATQKFSCLGSGGFKTKYPTHWSFARNSIFLENLGW